MSVLISDYKMSGLAMGLMMLGVAGSAQAAEGELVRHKLPNSDFPISLAVEVPANKTVVHLSGQVPTVIDEQADPNSLKAYGTIEQQTVSTLKVIENTLASLNLSMSDVYRMQVFLVAEEGKVDFASFMKGYTQFFGTKEQPNLPVRSAVEVAALVNPGWLIEIEVSAVRP
ncbi:RidA family protein [Oceanisphaera sp. W20_SRM_FM3]|uniref:RidA family protein n=1 Tax=Oceanisphaera sp. W20_SRM_FM3 TaxID=3240267 RepID=UPI003F9704AF